MEESTSKNVIENISNDDRKSIESIIQMALKEDITWEILALLLNDFSSTLIKSQKVINVLLQYLRNLNKKVQEHSICSAELDSSKNTDTEIQSNDIENRRQPNESEIEQNDLQEDILEAVRNMDDICIESDIYDYENSGSSENGVLISEPQLEAHEHFDDDAFAYEQRDTGEAIENIQDDLQKKNDIQQAQHRDSFKGHNDNTEKPFQCKTCAKSFKLKQTLKVHERIHTGEKPFQCKMCKRCFSQSSSLRLHEKRGQCDVKYECNVCGRMMNNAGNLKVHEATHRNEKSFQCSHCHKVFHRQSRLNKHKKIHSRNIDHIREKFPCQICHKSFVSVTYLKDHENVHSGDKPYQCKTCSKCFAQSATLKSHERTHTGEKPYKCPTCNRCFANRSSRAKHIKYHRKGRPHQCKKCNKFFEDLSRFEKHVKTSANCGNEVMTRIDVIY